MSELTPPVQQRAALWLLTAVLGGAIIMGLEMTAFRLYAPYFGYSIYVWGSLIAVVMAALAAGYAVGGWLADRNHSDRPLFWLVAASGLYQVAVAFSVWIVLPELARFGEIYGPLAATLIIFVVPMVGLAAVGPYAIRLLARTQNVGLTAGRVYALSTLGSIAGVLVTSFYLIPVHGTRTTLLGLAVVTILLGAAGLFTRRPGTAALLIAVILLLPLAPGPAWDARTIWSTESAYNLVRVEQRGPYRLLFLNAPWSMHTIRNEEGGWTGRYYDDFALGPLLVPGAKRVLVLGMGAGGSIEATRRVAPDAEFDAVEIDPAVVEAAYRFFDVPGDAPWLRIATADARPWLASRPLDAQWDLVHLDLYQGGPYVPFYLSTVEFYRSVKAHLARDGAVMLNLFDLSRERELLNVTVATLSRVFPSVLAITRRQGNHLLVAFPRETPLEVAQERLRDAHIPAGRVREIAHRVAAALYAIEPPAEAKPFTDDLAPVEMLTHRAFADLLYGSDSEN